MKITLRALPLLLVAPALSAAACVASTPVESATETRTSNLDFETGRIEGIVTWNGLPVGDSVRVEVATLTLGIGPTGQFVVGAIAPGSYELRIVSACDNGLITEMTVAVSAGQTTTLNIDVSAAMGHLSGSILVNGMPAPTSVRITAERCPEVFADGSGFFSTFVPVGNNYQAVIYSPGGALGAVFFDVAPGSEVVFGGNYAVGTMQGSITWNGEPVTTSDHVFVSSELWGAAGDNGDGRYVNQYVPPGDLTLVVVTRECFLPMDTASVTIAAGATTNTDFDLTTKAGRVVGAFTVDGVPVSGLVASFSCGTVPLGDEARLSRLLPAGSYNVSILGLFPSATPLGELSFTVTPGQTTDLGIVNYNDPRGPVGTVVGTVFWNGVPISGQDVVELREGDVHVTATDRTGHYRVDLPPGAHSLSAWSKQCGRNYGEASVSVATGATATADFDLTNMAGRVTGHITVNGAPLRGGTFQVCGAPIFTDTNGGFSVILPSGVYDAQVGVIGSFSFAVVARQTTDMDILSTEEGTNVAVNPGSGVSLLFDEVTDAGSTSVVVSGQGPPPPTGYEIYPFGAPRYWDIDTTATYAGQILVCITFDPDLVVGDPSGLTLRHYKNSTTLWENITMGPPVGNQICGLTDSLSPFALMMPVAVADTDPPVWGDVPDPVRAFATSTAGAIVNYTVPTAVDAVEGPVAVSCTPASGSQFPINKTPVTCTAVDASGNATTKSFAVWVTYEAPTDGTFFVRPIRADGSSRFKIGRAVPVKFRLAGASAGITNLRATLTVTKLSDAVKGTTDDESDEDGDDDGFVFKYRPAKNIYAYRWKTSCETRGTYLLHADLGDGVTHQINVSLRNPK